jgi:hypothetical protein
MKIHYCIIFILELSVKSGQRQHQYPEFGHKQGEILKKNLQKSILERTKDRVKLS